MPRPLRLTAFALAAFLAAAPARAGKEAPPPPAYRAATAETVVIGKVVRVEDKPVAARRFEADTGKGEFKVAVVKIDAAVVGARGLTEIRVGFLAPFTKDPRTRRPYPAQLDKGDEVILFLYPHMDEPFYTLAYYYDVVFKQDDAKAFEQVAAAIRPVGKLLKDPTPGLTSKDADERYRTAATLIAHYRAARSPAPRPTKVSADAKESRLILEALAEADWLKRDRDPAVPSPVAAFFMLGLNADDGWTQPEDNKKVVAAAKKWVQDNDATYRIQKQVYDKKDQ